MTAQTFKETIIQNMNSIEQCIIERASHEQELKMTLKKLSVRQLQIQHAGSRVNHSYKFSEMKQAVGIKKFKDTPLEQVQNHDASNVFANERRHSEQPESINDTYVLEKDDSNVTPDSSNICNNDNQVDQNAVECAADERAALANLIANLTLDTEENKTILKQLKKANASLTQELKECKTNLDETSRALGAATSSRDSTLIALQTKQTELENCQSERHDEASSKRGTSFNGQKQQRIDITADALYNEKQENLRVWLLKFLISKKPVPDCSGLVLHQMTSDHNRSELGIQDHSNEQSSSKLVPKVVP
ncbi:hypothetical protein Tco_0299093 [Tanacetum coccineum]